MPRPHWAVRNMTALPVGARPGDNALARFVRERQDLIGEWQARDKLLIAARAEAPVRRNARTEAELNQRLISRGQRTRGCRGPPHCVGVTTLGTIEQREVVEPGAYLRMVGPKATLGERQHALGYWRRFCVLPGLVQLDDLPIETLEIVVLRACRARPSGHRQEECKTCGSESSYRKDV